MTSQFIPKPSSSPLNSKGFTLVELAVVLVILGAIFTSVLKVESMIKNAKIRQVVNQYRELRTAILIYKDKYGYLPGDDPYAVAHVGAITNHAGNGDQKIAWFAVGKEEYSFASEHLSKAGLIKENYNGLVTWPLGLPATPIKHVFNGIFLIQYTTVGTKTANAICIDSLPPDVAQAIDTMLDDGNPVTGVIVNTTFNASVNYAKTPYANYQDPPSGSTSSLIIFFE